MSQAGDVLRRAAADVGVRGVPWHPRTDLGETCAIVAIVAMGASSSTSSIEVLVQAEWSLMWSAATRNIADWNDSQPSRAVVAAEMRSAADLADLLYGDV